MFKKLDINATKNPICKIRSYICVYELLIPYMKSKPLEMRRPVLSKNL